MGTAHGGRQGGTAPLRPEAGAADGGLAAAVAASCRRLGRHLGTTPAQRLERVASAAAARPRLVVTGPVSSGKSTLVNALVGRRVAPTGAGECTRLPARYVRGAADRLDVVLRDGTRRPLPLAAGGGVPGSVGADLGVGEDEIDHLVVTVTSDALAGWDVVDTPGTGSARRRDDHASGVTRADAALVVLSPHADGGASAELAPVVAHGPPGVVAVLGRADTLAGPGDASATSAALAGRLGAHLGPVTPVIGLLAETAVTGVLRTDDVPVLAALAALDDDRRELVLLDPDGAGEELRPGAVRRVLDLLDRHGIELAVALLRERPGAGVGEIRTVLLAASGLDELAARLDDEIRTRAELLRGRTGLRALRELAAGGGAEAEEVRDAAEELDRHPAHAEAELLAARAHLRAGLVDLDDELTAELDRLVAPGAVTRHDPDGTRSDPGGELAAHLLSRAAWWRSWSSWGASPARARLGAAVHRGYVRAWGELTR